MMGGSEDSRWDPDWYPGRWEWEQVVGEDLAWLWAMVCQAALCQIELAVRNRMRGLEGMPPVTATSGMPVLR